MCVKTDGRSDAGTEGWEEQREERGGGRTGGVHSGLAVKTMTHRRTDQQVNGAKIAFPQ